MVYGATDSNGLQTVTNGEVTVTRQKDGDGLCSEGCKFVIRWAFAAKHIGEHEHGKGK